MATGLDYLRERVPDESREDLDWLWRLMNADTANSIRFMGFLTAVAADHPQATFWQLLASARKSFRPKRTV